MLGVDILNFNKALDKANIILKKDIETLEIVLVAHVLTPRGYDNPI